AWAVRRVADPAAPEPDVLVLGHRPLRARAAEELLVPPRVLRQAQRAAELPAVLEQTLAVGLVVDVEAELEGLARPPPRQVEELQELVVLAPVVDVAVVDDVLSLLAPVPDRRVGYGRAVERRRPQLEVDRLAGLLVLEA